MKYAATLASVLCCLAIPVSAEIVHVWDLADAAQTGQFTVYNPDVNDAEFGTPITAGDISGRGVGRYLAGWDGRNDEGCLVASGVYWARLRVGSQLYLQSLMYIK